MNPVDLLPILGIAAVMYFMIIRPQMREKQDHEKFVASLSRGDKVVTASGIHGTVQNVTDDTVQLEVSERTRMVIDKTTVARRVADKKPAEAEGTGTPASTSGKGSSTSS